jgi:hypothetical protein
MDKCLVNLDLKLYYVQKTPVTNNLQLVILQVLCVWATNNAANVWGEIKNL